MQFFIHKNCFELFLSAHFLCYTCPFCSLWIVNMKIIFNYCCTSYNYLKLFLSMCQCNFLNANNFSCICIYFKWSLLTYSIFLFCNIMIKYSSSWECCNKLWHLSFLWVEKLCLCLCLHIFHYFLCNFSMKCNCSSVNTYKYLGLEMKDCHSLTSSFWIAVMRSRAASTCALCPVMTITSLSLPSDGNSILVSVSSRIC